MTPTTAYVALGSNLGDRAAHLGEAVVRLAAIPGVAVGRTSSFLDNPAVGGPADSPPFVNAVVEVRTTLSAADLLAALLDIEAAMGRRRKVRWDPRPIDLDLLLFGDAVIDTGALAVPHPLMHRRRFVLEPLVEIAPEARHPTSGRTAASLLADLDRSG